jgi:hypothetical protein
VDRTNVRHKSSQVPEPDVKFVTAALVATLAVAVAASEAAAAPLDRPVHRYLSVAISPDGRRVASVEGDASMSGGYPVIRDLVIRDVASGAAVTVALPCGRVAECWPASAAWSPDGRLAR